MNWYFWKCFGLGLVGIALHITSKVMNKGNGYETFRQYFTQKRAEVIYAVLSYIIIVALWSSGELFKLPALVGMEPIQPIPVSYWSALVGYFSSSIMGFLLYAATAVSKVLKTRFGINNKSEG